jgi:CHAT domain-containing protein
LPRLLASVSKRVRAITFVPDDVLHGLPFAAIPYKEGGGYILEEFALSIGYEWLPVNRPPALGSDALVVAVPQGAQEFEELPAALDECRCVVRLLSSSGVGPEQLENPSKEIILDRIEKVRFLHVACHGTFRPDAPSESGIVLISASKEVSFLTLKEISRLNLRGIEQVFLSSCWSADSFILPGRWVLSLPETIWRAGARSIIASLWRLSDDLASPLVETFYRALTSGASRDRALQQAQLACARGKFGDAFQDPAFWAGLRVCGESGVVDV